ncbi:MAG: XF1762 family protein [Planctomycetota bacterium]
MSKYERRPVTIRAADKWVREHHRHLKSRSAGMFALAAADGGDIVAVMVLGRPKARAIDDGWTLEVSRLAAIEGHANACSWMLGRARRIAGEMGFRRVVTYTRLDEPGSSLRASGFRQLGTTRGGQWGRQGRERSAAEDASPKRRWLAEVSP